MHNYKSENIDALFQDYFSNHEVPVLNRNRLWNRIIRKNRTKKLFIILLCAGLLLSITTWMYQSSLLIHYESDEHIAEGVSNLYTNDLFSQPSFTTSDQSSSNFNPKNSSSNNVLLAIDIKSENDPITEQSIAKHKISNANPSIRQKNEKTPDDKLNPTIFNSNEYEPSKSILGGSEIENEDINQEKIESTIDNVMTPVQPFQRLESLLFQMLNLDSPLQLENTSVENCKPTRMNGHFFTEVYSGVGVSLDRNSLNPAFSDQINYLDNWNERYRTLPTIMVGVNFGFEFDDGIEFSIGAEYQRVESQYETVQTITETVTVYDPMAFFYYDVNDEVVWVGDSVTAVSTYDRTVSLGNSSRLFNIPFSFAYPLYRKGQMQIKARAAGLLNMYVDYRGRFLRPDGSLAILTDMNQDNYVTKNLGLSLEVGFMAAYTLADNWEIVIAPAFRLNNKSYWLDSEAINQSRYFIKSSIGLRYHFRQ